MTSRMTSKGVRLEGGTRPPAVDPGHPSWAEVDAEQRERADRPGSEEPVLGGGARRPGTVQGQTPAAGARASSMSRASVGPNGAGVDLWTCLGLATGPCSNGCANGLA